MLSVSDVWQRQLDRSGQTDSCQLLSGQAWSPAAGQQLRQRWQLRAAEGSCLCRHGPRVLRGSCGRGACSCSLHSAQPSIDLTLAPSYLAPLILTRNKCGVRTRVFVRTRVCGDTCIDRSIPAPLLLSTTRCRHAGERWGHHQMAGHISKIPSLCSPLSSHIAMHYSVVLRTQTRAFLPFF